MGKEDYTVFALKLGEVGASKLAPTSPEEEVRLATPPERLRSANCFFLIRAPESALGAEYRQLGS